MPMGSPSLRSRITRVGRATGNRVFAAHNKLLHRTAGVGHAKSFTYLLIALLLLPLSSQAQTLALTFDDGLDPREQPQAVTWNRAILEALSKAHIRSVLFVAGERVDSPEGLALVRDWGIAMFISKGWTFVSPEEAYEDPIYAKAPSVLPAGESVLWSLAKQRGFSDLRYPAEDSIYEKPLLDELGL